MTLKCLHYYCYSRCSLLCAMRDGEGANRLAGSPASRQYSATLAEIRANHTFRPRQAQPPPYATSRPGAISRTVVPTIVQRLQLLSPQLFNHSQTSPCLWGFNYLYARILLGPHALYSSYTFISFHIKDSHCII
jgi:hypothetical protein